MYKLILTIQLRGLIYNNIEGSPLKRFKIPDDKWRKEIAKKDTMIIVDKNEKSMYIQPFE